MSLQDSLFTEDVEEDLQHFLKSEKRKRVLIFPPVNNYRRFLIHQLVQDRFGDSLQTFSIGQGFARRTVVCYKSDFIRLPQVNGISLQASDTVTGKFTSTMGNESQCTPTASPEHGTNKPRQIKSVEIYRPPAARRARLEKSPVAPPPVEQTPSDNGTRSNRQKRPDRAVYVPRHRRHVSDLEVPAQEAQSKPPRNTIRESSKSAINRSTSNQKTIKDSANEITNYSPQKTEKQIITNEMPRTLNCTNEKMEEEVISDISADRIEDEIKSNIVIDGLEDEVKLEISVDKMEDEVKTDGATNIMESEVKTDDSTNSKDEGVKTVASIDEIKDETKLEISIDKMEEEVKSEVSIEKMETEVKADVSTHELENEVKLDDSICKMEEEVKSELSTNAIISLTDEVHKKEKRKFELSVTCLEESDKRDRRKSDDNVNSENSVCNTQVDSSPLNLETCDLNVTCSSETDSQSMQSPQTIKDESCIEQEKPVKQTLVSKVLKISSIPNQPKTKSTKSVTQTTPLTPPEKKVKKVERPKSKPVPPPAPPSKINRDECDWDSLFDDNGDCLDPSLIEELTTSVGEVVIEKPKSSYKSYTRPIEVSNDEFAHVLEIYNFPSDFKSSDLAAVFSSFKNGGFELKWVDDTHCLGVFSSPLVAAEVLAADHPFVKTRPLSEATALSRTKVRRSSEFLQPYRSRPETCAALARRLVTKSLGVKLATARQEREQEKIVLREAKEKRRLANKQRDDVWEGIIADKPTS